MADVQLSVDQRMITGKKVSALRRDGIIPAHLYGRETESLSLQASTQSLTHLLRTAGGNAVIDLQINGESEPRPVVLRGVQRDPVNGALVHIDFFQISLTEKLRSEVPLVLTGEAPGVSVFGGVLLQNLDRVVVEALPADIPQHIEVDVSRLEEIESSVFLRELGIPANVEVIGDLDQVVAKVAPPRLAQEIEAEEAAAAAEAEALALEEGEEPEEGEEVAEGEEAPEEEGEAEKSD